MTVSTESKGHGRVYVGMAKLVDANVLDLLGCQPYVSIIGESPDVKPMCKSVQVRVLLPTRIIWSGSMYEKNQSV